MENMDKGLTVPKWVLINRPKYSKCPKIHLPKLSAQAQKFGILMIKFMFSKKATKIDEFFTVDLTICSKHQIDGEDIINFRGLLRKYEL